MKEKNRTAARRGGKLGRSCGMRHLRQRRYGCRRAGALLLALAMIPGGGGTSAEAWAAPKAVSADETMYVNLDWYGQPEAVNVVKGCSLNGLRSFTDYGTYLNVENMSTMDAPEISGDQVKWNLSQDAGERFYYKCAMDPEQVEMEETTLTLAQYESMNLDLLVTPANATNQRFTWTYSQDGIVKVNDYVTSTPGTMTTTHTLSALEQGTVTVTGTPLDDTKGAKPIQFTVTVTQPDAVEDLDFDQYVTGNIRHALSYLDSQLEGNYTYGAEWSLFTLLRAGASLSQSDLDSYYASITQQLESGGRMLPTDYFRVVVALLAMGKDPTDVAGMDLIETLYNYPNLDRMTSNMMSYTLLALDTKDYEVPQDALWTRETLIEKILTFQNANGGFGLSSADTVSVDVTAMTLQALAPYRDMEQVGLAFDRALEYLRSQMTSDCGYINEGDDNGCTAAQVLTALAVAGIDPLDPDNGFTHGNYNLVTKLDQFKRESGFTTFMSSDQPDGMGTAQIGYALEAYRRFVAGENTLFDLTQWTPAPPTEDGDSGENPGSGEEEPQVPQTGDTSPLVESLVILGMSAAGLCAAVWTDRKRKSRG